MLRDILSSDYRIKYNPQSALKHKYHSAEDAEIQRLLDDKRNLADSQK